MGERYFEVDAVRGCALVLMVLYHTVFCLYFFSIIDWFDPRTMSGAPVATMFVFIAGLSLVLAGRSPVGMVKRGLQLLLCGLVITAVTFLAYPQGFVIFGILHLIGIGTILAIPFVSGQVKWFVLAAAGVLVILLAAVLPETGSLLLLPFGMPYAGFTTLDYEPLIPWFGVMLLGAAAGKILYPAGKRCSLLANLPPMPSICRPLCFLGRHTLLIYMLHVPVIICGVFLLFPDAVLSMLF